MIGGELVTALAEAAEARLLPVDSEHSALFAADPGRAARDGRAPGDLHAPWGGPFRGRSDLDSVTPEEALAHPTWEIGGRITVDCANLMNKGFEVIEAHHLFGGLFHERIEVVVPRNRSSIRWSTSTTAPRLPTSATPTCGSRSPTRCTSPSAPTSSSRHSTWRRPAADLRARGPRRPSVPAACPRGRACRWHRTCVLNAADEVAVGAFLEGRLGSPGSPRSSSGCSTRCRRSR